jgi:hypothetical protein
METLTLTSVSEAYTATATVLGRTALPVFFGARDPKELLTVQFTGAAEPESLVERPLRPNSAEIWKEFHDSDVPVTSDIFVGAHNKLLVPNLKARGSELYGKCLSYLLGANLERDVHRPEIDEFFVGLLGTNEDQVDDRITQFARTATQSDLLLPQDDPLEMIVHPDGSWNLIVLDLAKAMKMPPKIRPHLEADNSSSVLRFQGHLDRIFQGLVARGVRGRSPARQRRS